MPSPAITGMAKQRFGPEVPVDAGGSASDRLVGVSRASTIGRCVPPNCRGGLTGATAADSRRYDAHGRVKSERWEPGIEPRTRGFSDRGCGCGWSWTASIWACSGSNSLRLTRHGRLNPNAAVNNPSSSITQTSCATVTDGPTVNETIFPPSTRHAGPNPLDPARNPMSWLSLSWSLVLG